MGFLATFGEPVGFLATFGGEPGDGFFATGGELSADFGLGDVPGAPPFAVAGEESGVCAAFDRKSTDSTAAPAHGPIPIPHRLIPIQ